MASKRKESEYSDIYKLKSGTSDAKNKRLQRRSLDWKNQRDDEVNKRRNLANLSPLQELTQNSILETDYKGKTPVKTDSKAAALRQKLAKWKLEKEAKKKEEQKSKKPNFGVFHVEHKDKELFVKNTDTKHLGDKKKGTSAKEAFKKPVVNVPPKPVANVPATKTRTVPTTRTTRASTRTTRQQTAVTKKESNTKTTQPTAPLSTSQQARKGKEKMSAMSKPNMNVYVKEKTSTTSRQNTNVKEKTSTTSKQTMNIKEKTSTTSKRNMNLNHHDNVSTYRGESFAPNDFTFTVPTNITSFTFTPLSPSSAAAFLYPNQDADQCASFIGTVPKRCSTPKSGDSGGHTQSANKENEETKIPTDDSVVTKENKPKDLDNSDAKWNGKQSKIIHSADKIKDDSGISSLTIDSQAEINNKELNSEPDLKKEVPRRSTRSSRRSETVRDRSVSSKRRHVSSDQTSASETEDRIPKRRRKSTRKSISTQLQIKVQVEGHTIEMEDHDIQSDTDSLASSNAQAHSDTDSEVRRSRRRGNASATPEENANKSKIDAVTNTGNEESGMNKKCDTGLDTVSTDVSSQSGNESESDKKNTRKTRRTRKSVADRLCRQSKELSPKQEVQKMETDNSDVLIKDKVLVNSEISEVNVDKVIVNSEISEVNDDKVIVNSEISGVNSDKVTVNSGIGGLNSDIKIAEEQKPENIVVKQIKDSNTLRKTRRSLRGSLSIEPSALENNTPQSTSKRKSRKSVSKDVAPETTEAKPEPQPISEPQVAPVANDTETPSRRTTRNSRKSMSAVEGFLLPNDDIKVLSSKRNTAKKRRKTTHDGDQVKSPEEWVKLLVKSPMVEMSRRTPKPKSPVEKDPTLTLNFDDLDESLSMGHLPQCVFEDDPVESTDKAMEIGDCDNKHNENDDIGSKQTAVVQESTNAEITVEEEHNVPYFRKLLKSETDKLNTCCDRWKAINDSLTEEVNGQIRTCIGQAQLLIAQRFKQFSGLVDNCEFNSGEKETTYTDLQGFWDMIYFQVEDVHMKFIGLEKLKENNWVCDKPESVKKVVKTKVSTKPKVGKPQVKSKFAQFRSQMKKQKDISEKVFDAGFFKVSSPVKSPKPHCDGGSPKPKSPLDKKMPDEQTEHHPITNNSETEQKIDKQPLQELIVSGPYTSPLITPARKRSYVPVVPSPLLKDSTPQSKPKRRSSGKKLLVEPEQMETETYTDIKENKPDNSQETRLATSAENLTASPVQNENKLAASSSENLLASPRPNDNSIPEKTTKSALKKSVRRSLRTRKSVSFSANIMSSESTSDADEENLFVPQDDQQHTDDLFMYLQPSNTRVSLAPSRSILEDICNDSFSDDTESAIGNENYLSTEKDKTGSQSKKRRSSLKELPSKDRRRSTRRSTSNFPSPITESPTTSTTNFESHFDVESSVFSPPESSSENKRFSNLNIGFTPVSRRTRPSLLYTPPKDTTTSAVVQDVPTDTLISFSP